MLWLKLLIIILLSCIAFEDFKYRMVKLIFYLVLSVALLILRLDIISFIGLLTVFGMNLAYLLFLLSVSLLTMYVRHRKVSSPFTYIGAGDLLLLFAFCIWFDTLNFILFNTISLVVALTSHFVLSRYAFYQRHTTIPLAGIQSLCFIVVFLLF